MIEFTQDQIVKASKIIKIIRLSRIPGMDPVAIKLNCDPTHDEIVQMAVFARALGYSTRGDLSSFEAAVEIEKERR